MLFELLHYHYFGLKPADIGRLSRQCGSQKLHADQANESYYMVHWRDAMEDASRLKNAGINDTDSILNVHHTLESWIQEYANVTLQMLIEKILTEGKILEYVLKHPNAAWHLELINTFFDFVKDESVRNPDITPGDLLLILEKMKENFLELPIQKIVSSTEGIHFMTAHGSKGLEFKHVFLVRSIQNLWEDKKGSNNKFAYPATLYASSKVTEIEDVRRLFFVAVTRAQTHLYISYSERNDDDKTVMPSVFLTEIFDDLSDIKSVSPNVQDVIAYKAATMQLPFAFRQLIDSDEVAKVLENFRISATSLNKYLECPLAFYFEKILRVPMARSIAMGYGNAVHYAFEMFFRDIKKSQPKSQGSLTLLLEFFETGMKKFRSHFTMAQFERYLYYGQQVLTAYYEAYNTSWLSPLDYEIEYAIKDVEHKGVPISGKLDKVSIFADHIFVTDYKTGNPDSAKLQPPKPDKPGDIGGDYWRQVVFYSLLIEGDKRKNWKLKNAVMDFVEKHDNKFHQRNFSISEDEKAIVSKQLTDTYQKIKNHDFNPGCGSEKCRWCSFVKYDILEKEMIIEIVDDDQEVQ
jgi:DNA helicase-2/ATP-dependent DNA helicase PcrA